MDLPLGGSEEVVRGSRIFAETLTIMFIVFNGRGWLVPLTAIGSIAVCAIADLRNPAIVWSAFALSGLVDYFLGKKWNSAEGRLMQDLQTGEVMEIKPSHSFFWIKMEYWLYIKVVLAALFVAFVLQKDAA